MLRGPEAAANPADETPLLELTHVRTVYFDRLIKLGSADGNVRMMLWRWKTIRGVLVRVPVLELVRPSCATGEIRAEIDRGIHPPPSGLFHLN